MGNKKKGNGPDVCWICCDSAMAGSPLISTGCACRGSAGLAHLPCLVAAAATRVDLWTTCPTCKQEFTGEMDVGLARARWETVRERPADDAERLFVANNLAVTLKESAGDNAGALSLMEEVLAVRRRTLGDEHADTLGSLTNLALQLNEMGRHTTALPLAREAVDIARRTLGAEHEHTLVAISCLAAVHTSFREFEAARPLHEEALEARTRLLGAGNLETMNSTHLLGTTLFCMGEHEKGLELLEHASTQARKVLGKAHPSSKHFLTGYEDARARRRDALSMGKMEERMQAAATTAERAAAEAAPDAAAIDVGDGVSPSDVASTSDKLVNGTMDEAERKRVIGVLEDACSVSPSSAGSLDELLDAYIAIKQAVEDGTNLGLATGGSEAEASMLARANAKLEAIIDMADAAALAEQLSSASVDGGALPPSPPSAPDWSWLHQGNKLAQVHPAMFVGALLLGLVLIGLT